MISLASASPPSPQTAQVKAVIEGLWARGIGAPGFLPTRKEMVAAGERSLYDVLTSLGGLGPLAEALGLRRRPGRLEVTSKAILEYLKVRLGFGFLCQPAEALALSHCLSLRRSAAECRRHGRG